MPKKLLIRNERSGDEETIHILTLAAFEPMAFSDGSEAPIIQSLRKSGDLTLSLVAEEDGTIIGHIAFSPVTIDGIHNNWFGLGRFRYGRKGSGRVLEKP